MDLEKYSVEELVKLKYQCIALIEKKVFEEFKPKIGTIFSISDMYCKTKFYIEFFKVVGYVKDSVTTIKVVKLEKKKTLIGLELIPEECNEWSDKKYVPLPKADFWKKHGYSCLGEAFLGSWFLCEVSPTEKEIGTEIEVSFINGELEVRIPASSGVEYDLKKVYIQTISYEKSREDCEKLYKGVDLW